jgi:hypothetical protein
MSHILIERRQSFQCPDQYSNIEILRVVRHLKRTVLKVISILVLILLQKIREELEDRATAIRTAFRPLAFSSGENRNTH